MTKRFQAMGLKGVSFDSPSNASKEGKNTLWGASHLHSISFQYLPMSVQPMFQSSPFSGLELDPVLCLEEAKMYPLLTAGFGDDISSRLFIQHRQPDAKRRDATTVFKVEGSDTLKSLDVNSFKDSPENMSCQPEVFVRVLKRGEPGYTAEGKSVPSTCVVWAEILTYSRCCLTQSFFGTGSSVFYKRPPVCFGLVAFGPIGFIVAIEWIGKLFVSPFSEPLVVGRHSEVVARGFEQIERQPFPSLEFNP